MKQLSYRTIALLLTVIFCSSLLQPISAQPLPDRRTLTGRITRTDGTPIGGASITLRRQDETATAQFWGAYAVSDARGEFTLPDIEEGAYYVDVDADGYAPDRSHDFTLDKSSPPLQIKLAQLVPLILRVLKPDGAPLANTTVMMRIAGEGGAGTRLPRTNTNEAGLVAFTLSNSEMPNCPLCRVVPSHYAINVIAPGIGYAVVKDLNVQVEEHPQPVDIRLQTGGTIHITAREETGNGNAPGKAIGGALVSMTQVVEDDAANRQAGVLKIPEDTARFYTLQRDPSGASLITRDGDGVVEFGDLPPGNYQVRVFAPNLEAPEPQNVQIKTGAVANVEFGFKPLQSAGTVAVDVRDAKNQPVPDTDFVVQLQPLSGQGGEAPQTLPPLPPGAPAGAINFFYSGYLRRARSDANGHFMLYPVKPGKYRLRLMLPYEPGRGGRIPPPTQQEVTVPAQGDAVTVTMKVLASETTATGITRF